MSGGGGSSPESPVTLGKSVNVSVSRFSLSRAVAHPPPQPQAGAQFTGAQPNATKHRSVGHWGQYPTSRPELGALTSRRCSWAALGSLLNIHKVRGERPVGHYVASCPNTETDVGEAVNPGLDWCLGAPLYSQQPEQGGALPGEGHLSPPSAQVS